MWPPAQRPPVAAPASSGSQQKNWFRRHPILTVILAVVVIAVIAAAASGGNKKHASGSSGSANNASAAANTPTTTPVSKPTKPKPSLTGPQQQAIESAQSYLSEGQGFSRAGLIHQLSSAYGEGFPKAVAVFAVDHVSVNWDEQAVQSAKGYKETGGGFSCAGMIHQLSSAYGERFTHAQAVYGARAAGVC
jgi:hypothetical protein